MSKDKFKIQFSESLAKAFQSRYSDKYSQIGENEIFSSDYIYENLGKPKDPNMGRFAFPVFRFGKLLGGNPPRIASEISEQANIILDDSENRLVSVSAIGAFINGKIDINAFAKETIKNIVSSESYGSTNIGKNQTFLIEYCSANIAKPFGVGHLRSTVIGNSLRRIFTKLGYKVIGINFLGDWGTQFGKMIVAYLKWGGGKPVVEHNIKEILDLYVKFHQLSENDKTLDDEARKAFQKLESGDPEMVELWEQFKIVSMDEFYRIFEILDVEFDEITGEAFFNDKMNAVIERLETAGITSISQGAQVIDLNDEQLPPVLLKKADGATLYATRDIAGLLYRWEKYKFFESLYVVGSAQADHFKQIFKAVDIMEDAENLSESERMIGKVKHIPFGWVKFGDKVMATRQGNIIFLEDVIDKAVKLAKTKIEDKNPDLDNIEETAQLIGVGAVIFSQLSVKRQKDVNFSWEEVLNFEGETGPYLQYTHARLCSLERKYKKEINTDIDFSLLGNDEEQRVIELLADYSQAIIDAARNYEPNIISSYLLKLASAFNKFYQRKDKNGKTDKIISENSELTAARIALVKSVQIVIKDGLYLLGLKAPKEM